MSVVKHRENEAVGGYFFTAKPYRGQGYGRRMYEYATGNLGDQCNTQTYALVHMKDWNLRTGLHPRWIVKMHSFTASCAVESIAAPSCHLQLLNSHVQKGSHRQES